MRHRLRPRSYLAFVCCLVFIIVCVYMYMILETASVSAGAGSSPVDEHDISHLQAKLKEMQETLQFNQQTIDEIKQVLRYLAENKEHIDWKRLYQLISMAERLSDRKSSGIVHSVLNHTSLPKQMVTTVSDYCRFAESAPSKTDIQMMDVFDALPFDNPSGGVWKQGYPIHYDTDQWKTRKLQVFVVPHSHNDPGWIKTFERYFEEQTRNILNLMVDKLEQYPQMRFIYAEMSFFSLWWSQTDPAMRQRVKKLLSENRLEIVTGGWVMTDEATAHYYAMLDQLIEGNQWLLTELGVRPVSGWAIDPFGNSPTMAYLLGQSGLDNMLIQRVHYSVKKHLSKSRQLEFAWRQNWDHDGHTDILCHVMPFYSYDVPHTCGPDPSICCQFDFKRLPGSRVTCPWKIPPVVITDSNVADRAKMLLHQYRQKAQLFQNDVVLVPLGDDFRYDRADDWNNQYINYQKLFDFMNGQSDWNVEVRFGTLTDYFSALRERARSGSQVSSGSHGIPAGYPVLSGDFFTYADRDDHYWSGYFTSRPFYKGLDRVVEGYQRAGEILYSLALASARRHGTSSFPESALLVRCTTSRRQLGLFQHHDGVTGTARDFVVVNYGDKLLEAIDDMKRVIMDSAQFLLTPDKAHYSYSDAALIFDVDDKRSTHDSLPVKTVINLTAGPRSVVFYNSLARSRTNIVRIHVNVANVEVRDFNGIVIASQVDPFFADNAVSTSTFKLVFMVTIPAFGLVRYTIEHSTSNSFHSVSTVTLYNALPSQYDKRSAVFTLDRKTASTDDVVRLENSRIVAVVSMATGILREISLKQSGVVVKTDLQFVQYGVRPGKERSGAYLFLPDGDAKPVVLSSSPVIRVIQGKLASEVHVMFPVVQHVLRISHSTGVDGTGLDILNLVDIRTESNYELAMRLQTSVANDDREFYTDLNGFQMQRRKTYDKLPLHANFYPVTTQAYLQDSRVRLTLLTGQSLGVASLRQGWLEVMQDRRLEQDDNRGLFQPVRDNKLTPNRFRIVIETRQPGLKVPPRQPTGFSTLLSHLASADLIHPVYVLPVKTDGASLSSVFEPLSSPPPPCDVHVVNLRTMQPNSVTAGVKTASESPRMALILHRVAVDCTFPLLQSVAHCPAAGQQVSLTSLGVATAQRCSLTLLYVKDSQDVHAAVSLPPMELQAFVVTLR